MATTTKFKMLVPRKKKPVNREELIRYWKGVAERGERELIVDNFAGGGGASTGIEEATGYSVDYAINHDPDAIAMHIANHPHTKHFCENVWDIDPRDIAKGRPVGLVWLSPDCTHHSKARGGKPRKKNIRGLAWVAVRWAATVRPRCIMLENVEEFQSWGPLTKENQPDPKQKGRTFRSFVNALEELGYEVEFKELRACDYGAPTIRKRFFLIARCDGQAIVWPEPTHGAPDSLEVASGQCKPWRTAAEIIDWSIPCPSIFDTAEEVKKKYGVRVVRPLADNTLRRIARGIMKFVINNPDPFIIKVNHGGDDFRGQEIDEPIQTMTAKNGYGLVTPYITRIGQTGFGGDRLSYSVEDPLTTITTKNEHMLISPTLIQTGYGEREGQAPRALDLDKPLGTVVAGGTKHALVTAELAIPHITKFRTGATGSAMNDPLHTITSSSGSVRPAGAAHAMGMVTAFLAQYHTETQKNEVRGQSIEEPLLTQDTSNRYAVITSNLVKLRGTNTGQPVDEPLHTITAGGLHHGEVRAFLIKYYGAGTGQDLSEPLHTIGTHDTFGLVMIQGTLYQIVDIGMRMLEPHELYAAQGFPSNYIIDGYLLDNGKPVTKSAQVARCGNSVPPKFSKALVRANLPHICIGAGKRFTVERYAEAEGQLQLSM